MGIFETAGRVETPDRPQSMLEGAAATIGFAVAGYGF